MVRLLSTAAGFGLLLGLMTQLGQSVLPDAIRPIANSISPWVTVAFLVASGAPRGVYAALLGFVTLVGALAGYYALVWLRFGYAGGSSSLVLWTVGAIAGGLVFGFAGWYWRQTRGLSRIAAISLLGAVWIAEGVYLLIILPQTNAGFGFIAVGLAVPLLAGSSWRERCYALLGLVPAVALGAAGYVAVNFLSERLAGL